MIGILALAGVVAATMWQLRDDDPPPAGDDAPLPGVAPEVLDDLVDDVLDPPTPDPVAEAPPTAIAAGARQASTELQVREAAWTVTDFGDVQTLLLIEHRGTEPFANVAVEAEVLDATGAVLERLEYSFRRVDPGQTVPTTSLLDLAMEDIAAIEATITARGVLPEAAGPVEFDDVDWTRDRAGTVSVTGTVQSQQPHEFVALVGVLEGVNGEFRGAAFGLVDSVGASPQPFEIFAFPVEEFAAVSLYAMT